MIILLFDQKSYKQWFKVRSPAATCWRPQAENARGFGAKKTEDQGLAGIRAPSPGRPPAQNARRLGATGTEDQGFAGIRAPSPRRPRLETTRKLGATGTEDQGFARIRAPSPRRPPSNHTKRTPCISARGSSEHHSIPTDPSPSRTINNSCNLRRSELSVHPEPEPSSLLLPGYG